MVAVPGFFDSVFIASCNILYFEFIRWLFYYMIFLKIVVFEMCFLYW